MEGHMKALTGLKSEFPFLATWWLHKTKASAMFIVLALSFFIAGTAYAGINDGLVAYYPFNGNANDESGNGHDGTVHGAALTEDRFGNKESAYSFDGVNDKIVVPDDGSFNVGKELTISLWIRFLKDPGCKTTSFVSKSAVYDIGPNTGYVFPYLNFRRCSAFGLLVHTGRWDFDRSFSFSDITAPYDWHFYASTYKDGSRKVYIDGKLVADDEQKYIYNNTITANNNDLTIGTQAGTNEWANAEMDDIRIYNRALSEFEIQELYSGITVLGSDVIYLSGRTDVTIPELGTYDPNFPILRHWYVRGDFVKETFPQSMPASEGMTFNFSASGNIHYFIGYGYGSGFGPDGGSSNGSSLYALKGISGYKGPQGALVGVFLDETNPLMATAPETLNFWTSGIGTSFETLSPKLGQVFFIGDGFAANGTQQAFTAPVGATRLFLGIPDGWAFRGSPGYYEDNDGYFSVEVFYTNPVIPVTIDIKPGSDPNSININSRGVIPVAVLTTEEFDAGDVDAGTVRFGPSGAYAEQYALEDVDDDGDIDLILHFRTQDAGIGAGDTEAALTGETLEGRKIEGSDSVRVLERKGRK
jgi:hypothetical protein